MEASAVRHKLPLSLEYNVNLGYHIHVAVPRGLDMTVSDLSTEFIQVTRLSALIHAQSRLYATSPVILYRYEKIEDPSR